jgi:ubiquinone/menaquinone biosynthesis C-methylase UbiE
VIPTLSAKLQCWAARREFKAFISLLEPAPTDVILDIGAGYGGMANMVADLCSQLLALEPDRKRIRQTRGAYSKLRVVLAVAEALPFREFIIDKVYMRRSFHHLTDQARGLQEIGRVLKTAGSILFQEVSPERQGKLIKFVEQWLRRDHVNFLTAADIGAMLGREGFLIKFSRPAVGGYFLVAEKK